MANCPRAGVRQPPVASSSLSQPIFPLTDSSPHPHPGGERVGAGGFDFNGLRTPALSSFGEGEEEKFPASMSSKRPSGFLITLSTPQFVINFTPAVRAAPSRQSMMVCDESVAG